jgi:zinc protease
VGAYDEPAEKAGLAAFVASALMRGTQKRSFEQVYEEIESVGASAGVSGGTHVTTFGAKCLADDLPLVLDVLSDALRRPTFPRDEVTKLRGEIITDLEERAHDTRRMASLVFHELAYAPEHPYSRSLAGYTETIDRITRGDLAEFHAGGYGPQGCIIVIVGAVETARALAEVEATLGDWAGRAHTRESLPEVTRITEVRERLVPIAGKTQSNIVLGNPGPARTAPDYLDAVVCNTILGVFGLMGRLGTSVREEQGLAYYSYSTVDGGPGPGPWRFVAGVAPRNVEQATTAIRSEIRRICQEPVDEEELQDNKHFLTGSLPLALETNEGMARVIGRMERYGLGLDYLQRYASLIDEITAARVLAVAQRWLEPDAFALAVAGPAPDQH